MVEHTLCRPLALVSRPALRQLPKQRLFVCRTYVSTGQSQAASQPTLTWREYLAIRGSKHKWQIAVTVPCALLGFAGGAAYFGNLDTDPTKMIMGIDPFFFYGISTVACVGAGALIGPSVGTMLWRMSHRQNLAVIDAMDREFYQRIAKNRVDASLQSPTSPIPDYYGEKIGSIHQYRQWLRDQAKYRRKVLLAEE
ncbi:mitochondrial import protein Pam17 [Macrolepiota fuliginosa MF-IS2]|uniref:Presequence translocated-associated motor subunit PAM17 n=1 Tax=Macrolepiota fuliginosa MF-IS2 TaxID=1400762 RepID=A0A9P6C597_9AGAR|nr:mitochondrial import protein Pam17 [Macrolepiota fuliginosa MF-IS2]